MSPPSDPYTHGVLGHWAVVGHGFNITSITCSILVIISVVIRCVHDRQAFKRTTFRISAFIAVCDIIYSVCQICTFDNDYMSSLSEINLRVIHWLMSASVLTVAFLSGCIGLELLLSVITNNKRIVATLRPWYEVTSFFLGFLITHPFLYLYDMVQWASRAQIFHIKTTLPYYNMTSWLTMWAWLFSICVFLFVVTCITLLKMRISIFKKNAYCLRTNDIDGIQVQERKELSDKAKKRIRSVCLRILAYPLIPIVTQIWILATNMTPTAPMWLYVMANIIPATQGMLNFLAFIANPAWDDHRKKLFAKCRQIRRNKVATSSTGSEIGFSRLAEEGTICSTPFSSTKFDDEKFEYK